MNHTEQIILAQAAQTRHITTLTINLGKEEENTHAPSANKSTTNKVSACSTPLCNLSYKKMMKAIPFLSPTTAQRVYRTQRHEDTGEVYWQSTK